MRFSRRNTLALIVSVSSLFGFAGVVGADSPSGDPMTYYVSLHGDDGWSGQFDAPNAEGADGPFATPHRAREAIRALKERQGGELKQPVRVYIRGGVYFMDQPLYFTPEDSGSAEYEIAYLAYPNERPILSGGVPLTEWQRTDQDRIWKIDVPREMRFQQLWTARGERLIRARYPNGGLLQMESLPDLDPSADYRVGQKRFVAAEGDLPDIEDWSGANLMMFHYWVGARLPIESVDFEARTVNLEFETRRRMTESFNASILATYFLENAREFLNAPNEWYLDTSTGELLLYPGSNPNFPPDAVIVPRFDIVMELLGDPATGEYVEHLRFKGLTFSHTEFPTIEGDPGDQQASANASAAVTATGARHCVFERCRFENIGNYGLELMRGSQHVRVEGCRFHDLGAGGVKIGEAAIHEEPALHVHNISISDCRMSRGGRFWPQAVGVLLRQAYDCEIVHNHIYDFYYTGLSVGWTWGYRDDNCHGHRVEYNHVHNIGVMSEPDPLFGYGPLISDMGGIYTLGPQPGTVIRHNIFHDIAAKAYGGWGIYPDEGTSYILAENNLVYRTSNGGFHQHYGRENIIRNNIFAYGATSQLERTRLENHLSFIMERNIIFWDEGDPFGMRWNDEHYIMRNNLYWAENDEAPAFNGGDFDAWNARANVFDEIYADPHFADPANHDFRLQPNSPAVSRIGFEPFSLDAVGPRIQLND